MDPNESSDSPWPDQPVTYWRRRVFALVAGLAALALLAWAGSGALGGAKPPRQPGASPTVAAVQPTVASPSVPAATPGATPSAATTAAATPSGKPRGAAERRPGASARAGAMGHPRGARGAVSGPRGRCAPGDVVTSLFVSQQTYQRWVKPQFSIYLVNIGRNTCMFDVGARSLQLVIRSGPVRVWGSGDCARGAPADAVRLRRGVPFVTYATWSRHRSSPAAGCGPAQPVAAPGTYTAMTTSGAVHSRVEVFALR